MKLTKFFLSVAMGFALIQSISAEPINACLQKQLMTSSDAMTIGELRTYCNSISAEQGDAIAASEQDDVQKESAVTQRLRLESAHEGELFSLQSHKPNYIILSNNMSSPNEKPFEEAFPNKNIHIQPWESKFQISIKVPLARDLFWGNGDLFAAYTNRSFWQQFNKDSSSPFRDTNHEPEVWLSFKNDSELWGFKNSIIRTGFAHQSNGQAGSLSRSWNRIFADFIVEKGDFYFSFKPWLRIQEDSDDDDNPDIDDYMGNFEFTGLYKKGSHTFDVMVRNNLDFGDNHGALQLGWSYPISSSIKAYVQWFNGYGESLIDYDSHSNSIGAGIKISEWL